MRFRDRVLLIRDDGEFEAKHDRDENGRFSKGASPSSSHEAQGKEQQSKKIDDTVRNAHDRIKNGDKPNVVIRDVARTMKGSTKTNLSNMGEVEVVVDDEFVRESGKYFFDPRTRKARSSEEQKEIAERMLAAYSHFDELLEKGKRTGWRHSDDHHPESDFLTIYGRFMYKGKNRVFTMDIKRPHMEKNAKSAKAYNMSASGNPGFEIKAKRIGKNWKDGCLSTVYVVGINMLV